MASNIRRRKPKTSDTVLRPVHPNAGIAAAYQKRLETMIEQMHRSITYFISASYRQNTPIMASDASPADALRKSMRELTKRWQSNFDKMSEQMAEYFAQAVEKRSSEALKKIMKDAGWTIQWRMTPAMQDVVDATVNQNVALIKSIPEQYLKSVEGAVMRSVQAGRDLGSLAKELEDTYGVTKRRAALIARTQNNLATASMNKVRALEAGLSKAVWVHSNGGKSKRASHVKASQEKVQFEISKGWYDPDVSQWIQPGQLINCKCFMRPVLKGFS